jgi:hypothetical protein
LGAPLCLPTHSPFERPGWRLNQHSTSLRAQSRWCPASGSVAFSQRKSRAPCIGGAAQCSCNCFQRSDTTTRTRRFCGAVAPLCLGDAKPAHLARLACTVALSARHRPHAERGRSPGCGDKRIRARCRQHKSSGIKSPIDGRMIEFRTNRSMRCRSNAPRHCKCNIT